MKLTRKSKRRWWEYAATVFVLLIVAFIMISQLARGGVAGLAFAAFSAFVLLVGAVEIILSLRGKEFSVLEVVSRFLPKLWRKGR